MTSRLDPPTQQQGGNCSPFIQLPHPNRTGGQILFSVRAVLWAEIVGTDQSPTTTLSLAAREEPIVFRGGPAHLVYRAVEEAARTADEPGIVEVYEGHRSEEWKLAIRLNGEQIEETQRNS